jgi:arabinan endo-1,5-alpha-L-arabinosidase
MFARNARSHVRVALSMAAIVLALCEVACGGPSQGSETDAAGFAGSGSGGSSGTSSGASPGNSGGGATNGSDDDGGGAGPSPDGGRAKLPDGAIGVDTGMLGAMDGSRTEGGSADATTPLEGGGTSCGGSVLGGGPTSVTTAHLDIGVHDPAMIWDGSLYYLFATGGTLGSRSSPDMRTWNNAGNVFSATPAWVTTALGSDPGSLWAPDISYFNGNFRVYYAGSSFGSNNSVIGLATTPSLKSPRWTDDGLVIASKTSDNFNAIDPNVSFDENCTPWLAFGSFWSGIKLRKLDVATGKLATYNTTTYALASRNGGAIEASSIIAHNGFYYLFVSFDACCKGVNSTYRTMVGRATRITGPYTDKAGADMMQGAAEQLLATSGRYIGPGGGTAWRNGNGYLYAYHYYDGQANGASKLQVRPISFDASDWITLGDPLFP